MVLLINPIAWMDAGGLRVPSRGEGTVE